MSGWEKISDHLTIYTPEIILPKISHLAWMNLDEYTFTFLKPSQGQNWDISFLSMEPFFKHTEIHGHFGAIILAPSTSQIC